MAIAKQKITPCLLFAGNAEEAARYYISIFKKSKMIQTNSMVSYFKLEGLDFIALNGPEAEFTWAVSLTVYCKTQKEVDYYWNKLKSGGEEQPCGWVKDKYGLSWQIVPEVFIKLINDQNPVKANRAIQAMMKMKKLDIAALKKAYSGK